MSINRHLARGVVLQILFELDINNNINIDVNELKKMITTHLEDLGEKNDGDDFIFNLLNTIRERLFTLDDIIARAAPEWPIDKINVMDRNIIRIGLAELLFNNDSVPPKVAIDEAIELAKRYSGAISHKFVNGVLGNIYKEMGEPRKDEVSAKKNNNLEIKNLAGGLVYAQEKDKIFFALIYDRFNFWTLPKGKMVEEEDIRVCAIRAIKDEIGIDVVIKDILKENIYVANDFIQDDQEESNLNEANEEEKKINNKKIKKHVTYFLVEGKYSKLTTKKDNLGILEARWFSIEEVENLKIYDDIKPILTLGLEKIYEIKS